MRLSELRNVQRQYTGTNLSSYMSDPYARAMQQARETWEAQKRQIAGVDEFGWITHPGRNPDPRAYGEAEAKYWETIERLRTQYENPQPSVEVNVNNSYSKEDIADLVRKIQLNQARA